MRFNSFNTHCALMKALCICVLFGESPLVCRAQNWHMFETKREVQRADPELQHIRIPRVPVELYPLLSKFHRLREISFYWEGADDGKLRALASLTFTNLQHIFLLDCPKVTDEGIAAIAAIPSVTSVGLEGAAITDAGLQIVSSRMRLRGINIANCRGVTVKDARALAEIRSLKEITFSANGWTQEQINELVLSKV